MLIAATTAPPLETNSVPTSVGGGGRVAEVDLSGHERDRGKVDELLVVGVTGAAEPGNLSSEGAGSVLRIRDHKPAAASRQEGDVGGAAGQHVEDAVANYDGTASDRRAR
jgi:hypothetical protein